MCLSASPQKANKAEEHKLSDGGSKQSGILRPKTQRQLQLNDGYFPFFIQILEGSLCLPKDSSVICWPSM